MHSKTAGAQCLMIAGSQPSKKFPTADKAWLCTRGTESFKALVSNGRSSLQNCYWNKGFRSVAIYPKVCKAAYLIFGFLSYKNSIDKVTTD